MTDTISDKAREPVEIEGSIYDGFAACLVRGGKTVAHVVDYADALAITAALQGQKEARYAEALRKIASCQSHAKGDIVDIARAALGERHD